MYGSRATERRVFLIRKMVLILVVLTIFSFSIVYAQEIYSMDTFKNSKEMNAANDEENKDELATNVIEKNKLLLKEKQKEKEQKKEELKEKEQKKEITD